MNIINKIYIDFSLLQENTVNELLKADFKNESTSLCLGVTGMSDGLVLANPHGKIYEIPFDDGFEIED